jgi:hypothetical protein
MQSSLLNRLRGPVELLSVLSIVWTDMNQRPRLISANVYEHLAEYLLLASHFFMLGTQFALGRGQRTSAARNLVPYGRAVRRLNGVFGLLLATCLGLLVGFRGSIARRGSQPMTGR